ncbi:MAG: hypothetical protein PHO14_01205 [Kiritimatiellae bacterium]|nr:hypothetical protein [Kiritimatiellia bacterium]MDD4340833.1 hypothetical protein [Kiritimatiellia bacterium]
MREIRFYKTRAGRSPVREFLDTLSPKQAQKTAWIMTLVEDLEVVPGQYFQKKTQKTPRQAIRLAEERKTDYFERKKR